MSDLDLCFTPATEVARRIRVRELSSEAVVRNALARIDEVNGALNCFVFTYPGRGDRPRAGRRRGRRAGRRGRAAARRADRDQGSDADRGQAHDARLVRVRAQRPRPLRAARRAAAGRRRHHGRQDRDAGVRLLQLHGVAAVGRDAQPVEHRAVAGRLVRRLRRGGRVGLRAAGRGHRHGRLGAHSGVVVGRGRLEAELRPDPARLPADAVRHDPPLRPAGAHRRRRAAVPARRRGARASATR